MTKRVEDLVRRVAGDPEHPVAPLLRRWASASKPFADFVEAHASKVHKKARLARTEEQAGDLAAELAVAAVLTGDRRFSLEYEPFHAPGTRGPDFRLTLPSKAACHVEVTRLRRPESPDDPEYGADPALRLARVLATKIGQLPPGAPNLLAVLPPEDGAGADLAPRAVRLLDTLASRPASEADERPLPGLGPGRVQDFARARRHLSAVSLWTFGPDWEARGVSVWVPAGAARPLPPELERLLRAVGAAR